MTNAVTLKNEQNESEKIRADAQIIGSMLRRERYDEAKSLKKAQAYIMERRERATTEPLDPEKKDYIQNIVRYNYTALKYEAPVQMAFNIGKVLLIGAISSIPATFIAAEINYRTNEDSLTARQDELETRLAHNKQETPIMGRDSQGDMVVTQGDTKKMLAETKHAITILHDKGRTITATEIQGGIAAGLFVAQIAIMLVSRAWEKTAGKIGRACADRITPLPQKHIPLPEFE